jgi:predicted SAM-dependent methyltransferase
MGEISENATTASKAMKLHLGCGQRYLKGYRNIDFPSTEHTVQSASVADEHADLLELKVAESSVEEIRLHHVFEHFPRYTACALVAAWQSWLKEGGVLRIEVPDMLMTGLAAINPFASRHRRRVAERHLFGSHEAAWAGHKEGYTSSELRSLLSAFGLRVAKRHRNSWRGTYNIDLTAEKYVALSRSVCREAASAYLRGFLLDESEGELRLLETWMQQYEKQIEKSWAQVA